MTKLLLFQCPICQVETTADVTEIVQCQVCGETLKRKPAMVSIDYENEIARLQANNREIKAQLDIQAASLEAYRMETAMLTDELERMKIRCILKLDPDSPIQKLNFGTEPKEGEAK